MSARILPVDPDARRRTTPVRGPAYKAKVAARIQRLKLLGMEHDAPIADSVTGGPNLVGNLQLIWNYESGRIEYAAPNALWHPPLVCPRES